MPYECSRAYTYPQSAEQDIVRSLGGVVYGPYTGRCFGSTSETDIEHIVATSELHDSGLCAASRVMRKAFAREPDNLTLAAPVVNRHVKVGARAGSVRMLVDADGITGDVLVVPGGAGKFEGNGPCIGL